VYLYRLVAQDFADINIKRDAIAIDSLFGSVMSRVSELRTYVENIGRKGVGVVSRIGSQIDKFVTGQIKKNVGIKSLRGMRGAYPIGGWVSDNVSLIKSIDSRFFDDLEKYIVKAHDNGTLNSELAKIIRERTKVSKSRADLIARDQVAKLNGQITAFRQQSLGIRQYKWSTAGDDRVRESHRVRSGRVFDWNNPPSGGHPGMEVGCRCSAVPVTDEDEDF
jgi:SPP1 gp7 family putative phage head morphogenesis protein